VQRTRELQAEEEVVGNKTLSTLNLYREEYDRDVSLDFLRLLLSEAYSNFNLFDNIGFLL